MRPRFGWRLPPVPASELPAAVRTSVVACEAAELDSFWLPDRLLAVEGYLKFLGEAIVLDPLVTLGYAAALTTRIELGTAVLVTPFRHPLRLAKQVASLQVLAGDRVVLGVGSGWNRTELRALGLDPRERGTRTDETLGILRAARGARSFEHHGEHFDFTTVKLLPPLLPSLKVLVAGGPSAQDAYSDVGDRAFAAPVLDRVARAEGWLVRPTTSVDQIKAGLAAVQARRAELGLHGPFTMAQVNWVHLVDGSREQALREQEAMFEQTLGSGTPPEVAHRLHWTGSLDDVRRRVEESLESGVDHVIASPLTTDPAQVELWVRGVLEPMGIKLASAGGGTR